VSRIRLGPPHRVRAAMVAGAAVVILAGAGLGYIALGGPADTSRARAPGTAPFGIPTDGRLLRDPALPGAEPVNGSPATTPAPASTAAASSSTTGTGQLPAGTGLPLLPALPAPPDPLHPAPGATAAPTEPAGPATTLPPAPTRPPATRRPLTATLSHVADPVEGGFVGYAGAVRIDNPPVAPRPAGG
jgi:hypothetical protein